MSHATPSTASAAILPRRIAVLGFARSGQALAGALLARGVEVSVGDARPAEELGDPARIAEMTARGARFHFPMGGSPSDLLAGADELTVNSQPNLERTQRPNRGIEGGFSRHG